MTQVVRREAIDFLDKSLNKYNCVLLLGPKQVGKTTLALGFNSQVVPFNLEKNKDRDVLENLFDFYNENIGKIIVLDEAQCMPELFPMLRRFLDAAEPPHIKTRWLILGTTSNSLESLANEHLCGRFTRIRLDPFNLPELCSPNSPPMPTNPPSIPALTKITSSRAVNDHNVMQKLWLRGGFPESYLASNDQDSFDWRKDFLDGILGVQLNMLNGKVRTSLLKDLWERLAIDQGKCNIEKLPGILQCRRDSIDECLSYLESVHLLRKVRPWYRNERKRLDKQPIWFIRDSGLLHRQVRVKNFEILLDHDIKGKSWEGFVLESIMSSLPNEVEVFFYRTQEKDEADFVLDFGDNRFVVIEAKYSEKRSVSRGFYRACDEIDPEQSFVVHGGKVSFNSVNVNKLEKLCLSEAIGRIRQIQIN